jgi:actin-like ATPase involved in cell morphogenesis|tara:strand:- start:993 stop:1250 length:258 start_codon:yes stop_codon:yes gene_type:complete
MIITKVVDLKTKTNITISFDKKETLKDEFGSDIQSKDYLYNTNIAFRLLNGDFNPLRKEIKLSSDKVNEFVERYKDLLIELTNEL